MTSKITYRPDIDGLRAVAVLAVLFHHLNFPAAGGGFLGVDVFFVISGYLMGKLLFEEIRTTHKISFLHFYERRARRILPALFVMMLMCCALSYALLLPLDLLRFADSIPGSLFFYANQHFLQNSLDYFLAQKTTSPLLHTWSLAVEEQFYLLLPLLLLIIMHRSQPSIRPLVIVMCLSLATGTAIGLHHPQTVFFGFSFRLWELLAGVAAASLPNPFHYHRPRMAGMLSVLALVLIVFYLVFASRFMMILFDRQDIIPIFILPLCAAVVLFIHIGESHTTLSHRIMALKPLTGIGLISYSLYLFHWPLLKYFEYIAKRSPDAYETIIYLCVCFIISILSWKLVETPFRTRRAPLVILACGAIVILSYMPIAHITNGFHARIPGIVETENESINRNDPCFKDNLGRFKTQASECIHAKPGKLNILLWGDSHAAHFYHGLRQLYDSPNITISQIAGNFRPPLKFMKNNEPNDFYPYVMALLAERRFDVVILSADWIESYGSSREFMLAELSETIERLAQDGIKIILVGPGIAFKRSPSELEAPLTGFNERLYRAWFDSKKVQVRTTPDIFTVDRRMRALFAQRYDYISLTDIFCSKGTCPYKDDKGAFIVFDKEHLTQTGSLYVVGRALKPTLDKVLASGQ
jgi:peptidoglycan/LPS O-acetylase OafA/YrhL